MKQRKTFSPKLNGRDTKMQNKIRGANFLKESLVFGLMLGLYLGWACPLLPKTITLIHSNDIHGIFQPYELKLKEGKRLVGGMEALSHYLNELQAKEENIMLIDLGDRMTGTLAAEMEYKDVKGGVMVEFMNRLGYDILAIGNHEFDLGQDNVLELLKLTQVPSLIANIVYKENGRSFPADPYHLIDVGGIKLGVIAVMEENFLTEVHKKHIKGLEITPIVPTLNAYVPVLDRQCDLVVVLIHSTFEDGIRIAENVEGVDVVLVAAEDGRFEVVNGVLVKSTYGHLKTLGYLKLEVEQDRIVSYEESLVWLWADVDLKPSPEIKALVQETAESLKEEYDQVVGEAKTDLNRRNYPIGNAADEIPLGNWIADVMRWKTKTQIGLYNSGGIRSGIHAGPITKADIFNVCPFRNTLVVFQLTGKQIKEVLEQDVEREMDRLQVSGLKYKYYPKTAKPYGQRVHYVETSGKILVKEGEVLWPEKIYTAVSNDYVIAQAQDKYFGFPVSESYNTGYILNQALTEWLDKFKVLDYKTEDRIVKIDID